MEAAAIPSFPLIPPGFILLAMGLTAAFPMPARLRNALALAAVTAALVAVLRLPETASFGFPFLGRELSWLRVDALSRVFGIVFCLAAFGGFVFAFRLADRLQTSAALFYIGGALGAVFAGDLLALYLCWEIMAVASTFLVLAGRTPASLAAAQRYILVHIFGGLLFLGGLILHLGSGGSSAFAAFPPGAAGISGLASWLILAGVLVNAAAPPLSSWMPDAYARSSAAGGVFLSAFTSKTAVYVLLRGFAGWEPLVALGALMVVYGLIYALFESDIRRLLAYAIINQVGFMVCAAGLGTPLGVSGGAANAFGHILYKSLLFMAAGSLLISTGRSALAVLEWKRLRAVFPWLLLGGLASSLPFTAGAVGKAPILEAFAAAERTGIRLLLEAGSAGLFIVLGLRLPYFLARGPNVPEAGDPVSDPRPIFTTMHAGMAFMALLCLVFGLFPQALYSLLPVPVEKHGGLAALAAKTGLLAGAAAVFWVARSWLRPRGGEWPDFDWIYRRALPRLFAGLDAAGKRLDASLRHFGAVLVLPLAALGAVLSLWTTLVPRLWMDPGLSEEARATRRRTLPLAWKQGWSPVGIMSLLPAAILALLFLL